ncbi:MAG: hypothetical protein JXK95_09345 [Bacteroidales bacterium]|nr:hypothetical protein [Bacteroidales bacterium]
MINYIDFNQYFIDHKNDSPYPLYPKHGIHWSTYGACLVADSIIQYIEEKTGYQFAHFTWDTIKIKKAAGIDYDIADGMNLIFKLKRQKMAYPEFYIKNDSGKFKPSLLVISDSFYWVIYGLGFANAFSQNQFWFYNKEIYPKSMCSPTETKNECLRNEIARHDVIIIMATEATLPSFGWGFIEEACAVFSYDNSKNRVKEDSVLKKRVTDLVNYIKTDDKWYSLIRKKALEKGIPIDSMLVIDALWQLQQEAKK